MRRLVFALSSTALLLACGSRTTLGGTALLQEDGAGGGISDRAGGTPNDAAGGAVGEIFWTRTFGDAERQVVNAVSRGPALDFVAGAYEGTLLGAPQELVNEQLDDVFVLGLLP